MTDQDTASGDGDGPAPEQRRYQSPVWQRRHRVAARTGAPTVERLTTPVESFPEIPPLCMAFSGQSGPRPAEEGEMERFRLAPR